MDDQNAPANLRRMAPQQPNDPAGPGPGDRWTVEQLPLLSAKQQSAISHLIRGKSIRAAARAAGIGRNSIHRWLKTDPVFRAAFNSWRQEIQVTVQARLMASAHAAVDVVQKAMDAGNAPIALAVLRGIGMLAPVKPGSSEVKLAGREIVLETRQARQELYTKRDDLHEAKEISNMTEVLARLPDAERWIAEDEGG